MDNKKQESHLWLIIGIAILVVSVFIVLFVFVLKNDKKYPFSGKWNCNDNIVLTIEGNNFDMYYDEDTYITSTFDVINEEKKEEYTTYSIVATAKKRRLEGKEYTDSYSTGYEIGFNKNNPNQLEMMNAISYNIYYCTKVEE